MILSTPLIVSPDFLTKVLLVQLFIASGVIIPTSLVAEVTSVAFQCDWTLPSAIRTCEAVPPLRMKAGATKLALLSILDNQGCPVSATPVVKRADVHLILKASLQYFGYFLRVC